MWSEQVQDLELQRILLREINEKLKRQKHECEQKYYETQSLHTPVGITALYQQITQSYKRHTYTQAFIIVISLTVSIFSALYFMTQDQMQDAPMESFFIIENLRGDKIGINTYLSLDNAVVPVRIIDNADLDESVLAAARSAITSNEYVEIDGKITHKTLPDQTSTYYLGWTGALGSINKQTKHILPKSFLFSENGNEKITIEFVGYLNPDEYDGVTKSYLSEDKTSIEKSYITIYDADGKSASEIETIVLHEFGHALGLKHSSDPDDLMAATITSAYPFISTCDIEGLFHLYDGISNEEYGCES